jgi:hypothetical protein
MATRGERGWFGIEQIRLERMKVMELPAGRTHLEFRIVE